MHRKSEEGAGTPGMCIELNQPWGKQAVHGSRSFARPAKAFKPWMGETGWEICQG
jgi:hypothetical protein